MTWYELTHRPIEVRGFPWDGTMACVRGHMTDEELEIMQPRLCRDEQGAYLMLNTLHDSTRTRPGDWIIAAQWPETGVEIYSVKAHVLEAAYEVGEALEFDPVEE